ncbi:Flavodoxin [Anaerovibrio lipolyticus DSM 3074]|nr:flavodoxin [Anaerovibrio lipolyticus]SHJ00857.1 Flavodoxin [Anaerovibrio lipolyticus DSM 3074]
MKKILTIMCLALFAIMTAACGSAETPAKTEKTVSNNNSVSTQAPAAQGKRILVAYFSRADENTGGVGYIEKGNTRILAEMAADITKGDLFEIKTVKPYPKEYRPATEVAKQEKENNERPEINGPLPDMSQYDVIFLGYPIWWSDLPMGVYTFLEKENFAGKTIIPFCTHEGSGIGNTERFIAETTKAKVLPGLEMRGKKAQTQQAEARKDMEKWVNESLGN